MNCPVSEDVLRKVEDKGLTMTAVLEAPSRYITGTTCTKLEGAADR